MRVLPLAAMCSRGSHPSQLKHQRANKLTLITRIDQATTAALCAGVLRMACLWKRFHFGLEILKPFIFFVNRIKAQPPQRCCGGLAVLEHCLRPTRLAGVALSAIKGKDLQKCLTLTGFAGIIAAFRCCPFWRVENREDGVNPSRAQRCKEDGASNLPLVMLDWEGACFGESESEDRPEKINVWFGQTSQNFSMLGECHEKYQGRAVILSFRTKR